MSVLQRSRFRLWKQNFAINAVLCWRVLSKTLTSAPPHGCGCYLLLLCAYTLFSGYPWMLCCAPNKWLGSDIGLPFATLTYYDVFLIDRPFQKEFGDILERYTSANDNDLAASLKVCVMETGSPVAKCRFTLWVGSLPPFFSLQARNFDLPAGETKKMPPLPHPVDFPCSIFFLMTSRRGYLIFYHFWRFRHRCTWFRGADTPFRSALRGHLEE